METNADLDEAESFNIVDALSWAFDQEWTAESLLNSAAIRLIHRRMFEQVWTWAGKYRSRDINIGNCLAEQVPERMEQILGNAAYQADAGRDAAALCADLHHGLTQVHAFHNGNGRHARLVAELLAGARGLDPDTLTWGSGLTDAEERRAAYLTALRLADQGDQQQLLAFIFS